MVEEDVDGLESGIGIPRHIQIPQLVQSGNDGYCRFGNFQIVHEKHLQSVVTFSQRGNLRHSGFGNVQTFQQTQVFDDNHQTVVIEFGVADVQCFEVPQFRQRDHNGHPGAVDERAVVHVEAAQVLQRPLAEGIDQIADRYFQIGGFEVDDAVVAESLQALPAQVLHVLKNDFL